ncbi:MAG: hypothetical protein WB424_07525, partial [Terracidiphilus sp.]
MGTPATPIPVDSDIQAGQDAIAQYTQQQLVKQNSALMGSIATAAQKDPDVTAEAQRLGLQVGVGADIVGRNLDKVRKMTLLQGVDSMNLPQTAPKLTKLLEDPNFSGVAYDDLGNLSRIEAAAAGMRAAQSGGGFLDRVGAEAHSVLAQFDTSIYGPLLTGVEGAGVVAEGVKESVGALTNKVQYPGQYYLGDELNFIWNKQQQFAVQKLTDPARKALAAGIIAAPPKQIQDSTGAMVDNPAYHWYGRNLANTVENIPGQAAAFFAGGEGAQAVGFGHRLIPALLGMEGAKNTYAEARAKGADIPTALQAALFAGASQYGLMAEIPGAAPTATVKGAIAQWAARSAAVGTGFAVADNTAARMYDPNRGLFEGLPQSIATMAAWEGMGLPGNIAGASEYHQAMAEAVEAAQASKLRERAPDAFQRAMDTQFEGDASIRIPATDFVNYWTGKKMDPAAAAQGLGVSNLAEALHAGSDLEIPAPNFFARLDPEDARALLPDVKNPSTDVTPRQMEEGQEELEELVSNGDLDKLLSDFQEADEETQASPEWQQVKGELKDQYARAGMDEDKAEASATLNANVLAHFARETGQTVTEARALHEPEIVEGETPQSVAEPVPVEARDSSVDKEGTVGVQGVPIEQREATSEDTYQQMNLSDLSVDPERFQYKLNTDASGVTNLLKGRKWSDSLADAISVWQDPEDGKTYVINGHHRFALAKENGVDKIWTKRIEAPDAETARAVGALQNIAAGRGTAMDAAKYFRDSGETVASLERQGVSMGEATAAKGIALSKLDPYIFDQVVSGKIREGRGVAIGNASSDPADQEALLKLIQKAESKGKKVSDDTVNELARMVKGAGQHTETQESLFGAQEMTHNLALEKADISSFIREKISQERRTFQSVASQGKAEALGQVEGQNLKPEENAAIAKEATQTLEIYDRLSTHGGTIDDILNRAAKDLANGGKANAIKSAAYNEVRENLREALASAGETRGERVSEAAQSTAAGDTGRTLYQSGGADESGAARERGSDDGVGGKRGWFRILPDGRFEIGKTYIGDVSTFIHEPAHAYLEMFRELTQRETASNPLKDNFKKICDWLGVSPEEAQRNGFTTEQHEKWAEANEQYVSEGKAPTAGLRRAFENFAIWMKSVYRRATGMGVELSPEVRGVMDRMYAGDDAVSQAEVNAPRQLFDSPEEAGWTEEEYQRYADSKGLEVNEAKAALRREMHEAWLREKTQDWRNEKANVRETVTKELDARPEYTAIRSLRRGALDDGTPLTLNRDALVERFGEERVQALQKLHRGLYRKEGGTDAETVAEILGYGSGEEMMRALETTPRRADAIEKATNDYMTAKHGDVRYDGTLPDRAHLALENEERAQREHTELLTLRRQLAAAKEKLTGYKTPIETAPLEHYQEAARQMIAAKAPADLQPSRYLNASRMFSREAFEARGRGNIQRAAEAKNKELLNHFLFREAVKEQEYLGKFESYAKRMQTTGVQQRLGLADFSAGEGSDYRDQFNWLLARYKMNRWPPQAPRRPLRAWADDMYDQGKEVAIAPG